MLEKSRKYLKILEIVRKNVITCMKMLGNDRKQAGLIFFENGRRPHFL